MIGKTFGASFGPVQKLRKLPESMERSCAENPQTPGAGRQCQVTPGQDGLHRMPRGTGQRTAWRMPLKMAEGMSNKDMLMAFTIFSIYFPCWHVAATLLFGVRLDIICIRTSCWRTFAGFHMGSSSQVGEIKSI